MIGSKQLMRIYASRVKAGGWALACMGMVALIVWMLLDPSPHVGPNAWAFQQPVKSILFWPIAAFLALGALVFLYWVVTPLPYLVVDETGLTIRRLPFVKYTVAWADVEDITASEDSVRDYFWKCVTLLLRVEFKPHAVGAYSGKSEVTLRLPQNMLPIPVEELVTRLRRYHSVGFVRFHPLRIDY